MALQAGGLRRARLIALNVFQELQVHLNPTSLKIEKAATVAQPAQPASPAGSAPVFVNTHTRKLTASIMFDAWSSQRDVAADVALLQSWLNPTALSLLAQAPEPPIVQLEWNEVSGFPGYLKRANADYTLFAPEGRPLRAKVEIEIAELPDEPPRQNPTSGSEPGSRTRIVRERDTLQSLAWTEYRDTRLWRALALANGIADPLRIEPGTRLAVPPLGRAQELAA
jgi:nucleoid-associated protein YgaU